MLCHRIIVSTLVLIALSGYAHAGQDQAAPDDVYYAVTGLVVIHPYHWAVGDASRFGNETWSPLPDLRFRIVGKDTNGTDPVVVLQFFSIKSTKADDKVQDHNRELVKAAGKGTQVTQYLTSKENDRYWWISKAQFDALVSDGFLEILHKAYGHSIKLTFGAALTVPFKLRPATGGQYTKLETDVNLGGYLGVRMRLTPRHDYFASIVAMAGLATLPVNTDNTSPTGSGTDAMAAKDTTMLGFTVAGGVLFELDGFQIGAMMGIDHGTGDTGRQWIYRDERWYSFSIGYSFIKTDVNLNL